MREKTRELLFEKMRAKLMELNQYHEGLARLQFDVIMLAATVAQHKPLLERVRDAARRIESAMPDSKGEITLYYRTLLKLEEAAKNYCGVQGLFGDNSLIEAVMEAFTELHGGPPAAGKSSPEEEQQGVADIILLQGMVGVTEAPDKARRAWRGLTQTERELTTRAADYIRNHHKEATP